MSTKAAHTPLPWKKGLPIGVVVSTSSDTPDGYDGIKIHHDVISHYGGLFVGESISNADAELIIRAVNHHDELRTRLYSLVNAIEGTDTKLVVLRIKEARETLKKVIE